MRRAELVKVRDKRLVEKFYELHDVKRRRMDDVLTELSEKHFFLDKNYIYTRLFYCKENNEYYSQLLSNKKILVKELEKSNC